MTGAIPVLAAAHFDPGLRRIEIGLPVGLTVEEIVRAALPGLSTAEMDQLRVALVTPAGAQVVARALWHRVRPHAGVRVVIRLVAGKDALRSVLSIVVSLAAVATGTFFAGFFTAGTLGAKLAFAGGFLATTALGQLLINALIPPVKDSSDRKNRYAISGLRNRLDPNGAVPFLLGTIRTAPPFAALSHTEIVGDWQYIRLLLCLGEGQVRIDDIRIGETSISEYTNVELETREGVEGDGPVTLYPRQIAEETVGVDLTRPLIRDELGEVIEGAPTEDEPVTRTTGADAAGASVILAFPSGLVNFDADGGKGSHSVRVRIEQRLVTAEEWQPVTVLDLAAAQVESFYRQHSWEFPSRGRWQIRLTMLTDETEASSTAQRCSWAALQTIRPEYPLNYPRPLALLAMRIKATHQLNGALDNISVLGSRICPDWDHDTLTWITRATTNPASLYRHALQTPSNPKAVGDSGLDLTQLQDWHDFCRIHGLAFSKVFEDTGTSLRDMLTQIAAAGRATPRHDGSRWGVTIDRPQALVVDHIDARNSSGFRATRSYTDPPHAFRVKFRDETNDYKEAERLVRWPGYTGEITRTEALELPGITDPALIWREARRRMYEVIYRCDAYQVTQQGPVRVATRGDKVVLNHYLLDSVQASAEVTDVAGALIELDQDVTMEAGRSYRIRFRVFADAEDTVGISAVRNVATVPGEGRILTLFGSGGMPSVGDSVLFEAAMAESLELIVRGIERAELNDEILHLVDAAEIIDELLEADGVPPWSGRVGAELDPSLLTPPTPRFTSIRSGLAGAGAADLVKYLLVPGTGAVSTASYRIAHRATGAGVWTEATIPAASGGGEIGAYANGAVVDLRAQAIAPGGAVSAWTATISLTVGAGDAAIPAALDGDAVTVTPLLGGALVQLATGADPVTAQVQVYRSTSAILDRAADAAGAPIAVGPQQSYSVALGDTTRGNVILGAALNDPGAWTAGSGWAVAGGVATHTPGAAGALSQTLTFVAGRWYRIAVTVSGRSAGSVTPRLTGGSTRTGTAATANGQHLDRLQAVTGNVTFELLASADFDGAVDDVTVYAETAACLSQGTHYLWLEPQNADGVPGPLTGPIPVTLI